MRKKLITLTSDFAPQSQGVGLMEGIIRSIAECADVIHLMHGLPDYDITAAARTLEAVKYLPVGAHVCVCDPGVGSSRKAIAVQTRRGDFLIGPDNGVLLPAARILGGVSASVQLTNKTYMNNPVSPIFHGRDVFAPAAAYLTLGKPLNSFGPSVDIDDLSKAAYDEALYELGVFRAKIIQINKFGSIHLNISHAAWDSTPFNKCQKISLCTGEVGEMEICRGITFSDVQEGQPVILKDDYGRIEIAINLDSFARVHGCKIGDTVTLNIVI